MNTFNKLLFATVLGFATAGSMHAMHSEARCMQTKKTCSLGVFFELINNGTVDSLERALDILKNYPVTNIDVKNQNGQTYRETLIELAQTKRTKATQRLVDALVATLNK